MKAQIMSMIDARALGTGGFWPYQKAMSRLQSEAPPMHPTLVREVLDAELGCGRAVSRTHRRTRPRWESMASSGHASQPASSTTPTHAFLTIGTSPNGQHSSPPASKHSDDENNSMVTGR
jgi:hypothetical protein